MLCFTTRRLLGPRLLSKDLGALRVGRNYNPAFGRTQPRAVVLEKLRCGKVRRAREGVMVDATRFQSATGRILITRIARGWSENAQMLTLTQ